MTCPDSPPETEAAAWLAWAVVPAAKRQGPPAPTGPAFKYSVDFPRSGVLDAWNISLCIFQDVDVCDLIRHVFN